VEKEEEPATAAAATAEQSRATAASPMTGHGAEEDS